MKKKPGKKPETVRYRCATGITAEATATRARQEFKEGQFIDAEIVHESPWLLEQDLVVAETEEKQ